MRSETRRLILPAIFILALTAFRLYYAGQIELANDEAYYFTWSRHLSPGYYDSGPVLGPIIRLFTGIFGMNELGVRFGSILFSVLFNSTLVFFLFRFLPAAAVFPAVVLYNVIPAFMLGSVLMMHDSVMIFFWLSALCAFYAALLDGKKWGYPLAGVFFGLGLWGKDTMLFILPCWFLFEMLSCGPGTAAVFLARARKFLFSGNLLFFLAPAAAIFSPVVAWNIRNGFPTYRHIFELGTRSDGGSLSIRTFFDFLGSQLGLVSPFVFLALAFWAVPRALRFALRTPSPVAELSSPERKSLFLLSFSVPVLAGFMLLSFGSKVEGNWSGFAYIGMLALLFTGTGSGAHPGRAAYYLLSVGFCLFMDAVVFFPQIAYYAAPRLPFFRREAVAALEADRTNEVNGWRQLGAAVSRIAGKKKNIFFFTRRYQTAASIEFYTGTRYRVFCFPIARRYNQYDITGGYAEAKGHQGYYLNESELAPFEQEELSRYFDSVTYYDTIEIFRPELVRDPIRRFFVYRCENFTGKVKTLAELRRAGGSF